MQVQASDRWDIRFNDLRPGWIRAGFHGLGESFYAIPRGYPTFREVARSVALVDTVYRYIGRDLYRLGNERILTNVDQINFTILIVLFQLMGNYEFRATRGYRVIILH